jgi:hypothetical protein
VAFMARAARDFFKDFAFFDVKSEKNRSFLSPRVRQ